MNERKLRLELLQHLFDFSDFTKLSSNKSQKSRVSFDRRKDSSFLDSQSN